MKYHKGGWELFGNLSIENGNNSEKSNLKTYTYANGNHVNIEQYAPNSFWYTTLDGKFGASCDFNEENSLGLSYNLTGSLYEGGIAHTQQVISRNGVLEGNIDQLITTRMSEIPQHEVNIYYLGKVRKLGIDFNGTWIWDKNTHNQELLEHSLQLADRKVSSINVNRNNMLAGKLVLTYPIWKGELGVGSELSNVNNHGLFKNFEGIVPASDDKIQENNIAAFAEYRFLLGNWSLKGGVRYESVISNYYSFGVYQPSQSRKYHDFFQVWKLDGKKGSWVFN